MHISPQISRIISKPRSRSIRVAGFSLVEVTFAIGVLGVAMVPLMGLIPMGMKAFREAIDVTVQTQIVQAIGTMAEQTNFDELESSDSGTKPVAKRIDSYMESAASRAAASPVYHYFNEQGAPVEKVDAVYTALVTYWVPSGNTGANIPGQGSSNSLATLWIDIYNNKGVYKDGAPIGSVGTFTLHIADFGKRI